MPLIVTILAAGKGTRMKSYLPKVLHHLAGRPLLEHVISTAQELYANKIIGVIGHGSDKIQKHFNTNKLTWVKQQQQLGTGHALMQTVAMLKDEDIVLVLYADVPLIKAATLNSLVDLIDVDTPLALLTVKLDNPHGYGRIIRNSTGDIIKIVEQKDANSAQKQVNEVNTGIMAVKASYLKNWLNKISPKNSQGEYYLTDIIALCVSDGKIVETIEPKSKSEVLGANDKLQLQKLEREYQYQQAVNLMQQGVTIMDATRLDIRGNVKVGKDVQIDVNVVFEGDVELGDGVKIEPNCIIKSCKVGSNVLIKANSHLDEAKISANCIIGPFARIRPATNLGDSVRIGNFVELKGSKLGKNSKVNHLSYIGDTSMGESCNIGAGTITCNYDGVSKHKTTIGDNVFVGSNSQLIAPVTLNNNALIGAGSTITKDAPAEKLTLSRAKQITIKNSKKAKKD